MRRAAASLVVATALLVPVSGAAAIGYCTNVVQTNCIYRDGAGRERHCDLWVDGRCFSV